MIINLVPCGQITSESIYGRCYLTGEALLLDDVSQVKNVMDFFHTGYVITEVE